MISVWSTFLDSPNTCLSLFRFSAVPFSSHPNNHNSHVLVLVLPQPIYVDISIHWVGWCQFCTVNTVVVLWNWNWETGWIIGGKEHYVSKLLYGACVVILWLLFMLLGEFERSIRSAWLVITVNAFEKCLSV